MSTSPQAAAVNRMQQLMSSSPVPSISTELLVTADGELNRELKSFLFDPPSDPSLLKGKRVTAWWSTRPDLENAGATFLDEPVVVDGNFVTSRAPIDLAPFLHAIAGILSA